MYYCKNCGLEFEMPQKYYENHRLNSQPYEVFRLCPNCNSQNFYEKIRTHCRCCGSKLPVTCKEYCSDSCRIKGEKLWKKELKRRNYLLKNPLNIIVRETEEYNKANGTDYSYGQYVAIVKPNLKEKSLCAKKKRNT